MPDVNGPNRRDVRYLPASRRARQMVAICPVRCHANAPSHSQANTAATEKAAADATDGVNAAMAYGTDGQIAPFGLVVLSDDKSVQPVYEPAPVVRKATLDKHPEIASILEPVFSALDLTTLQTLNAKIAVDGVPAAEVARSWLAGKGLIK